MGVFLQVLGSLLISGLCMCMGIVFAWPSSTFIMFASNTTALVRPMSDSELALFGSLSSIGALLGTPVVGFLLDRLGRKKCSLLFSLFGVLSWTLITTSNSVEVVLGSMFVAGLYGAAYLIVPVYISEICQDSIRGAMTSLTMIGMGIGILLSYIFGWFLTYQVMNYVCLSISVAMTVTLVMLKESPTFLLTKGLEEEAIKSMAFYRGLKPDSKEVQTEINIIKHTLRPDVEEQIPEKEKLNPDESKTNPVSTDQDKISFWKFLKSSPSSRRAFIITMVMVTLSIFQGPVILQVYAEPLFAKTMPNMPSIVGTALLAVISIVGGTGGGILMEKLGRRSMMIYSSLVITVICVFLGLQIHLSWGPTWLVVVNIYLFMVVYTCGSGIIPYVFMAEVFLPQIKSYMSMITIEWVWFCNSIVLYIFNPLLKAIGLGPIFYMFAGVGLFTAAFSWMYQPETQGATIEEIQIRIMEKKSNKL